MPHGSQIEQHPVKLLFVCLGNACRSQMAEAFANHFAQGKVQAHSAGVIPLGRIPSGIHAAMAERGISLDDQSSKGLAAVTIAEMDVVVTMGFGVDCCLPPGFRGRLIAWDILDPYGDSPEIFRESRDMIEKQVRDLLTEFDVPPPK